MQIILNPGSYPVDKTYYNVFVRIVYSKMDDMIQFTGVIGPKYTGGTVGLYGQIQNELLSDKFILNDEWTDEMVSKLVDCWNLYHMNRLTPGSPKQEMYLRKNGYTAFSDYDETVEALKKVGLYEDKDYLVMGEPYRYGSSWIKQNIPNDILDWLFKLPETKIKPSVPAWYY